MAMMARAVSPQLAKRLVALLDAYDLPTACEFDDEGLFTAAQSDKKRRGATLSLVVVETVGKGEVREVPVDTLYEYIRKGRTV